MFLQLIPRSSFVGILPTLFFVCNVIRRVKVHSIKGLLSPYMQHTFLFMLCTVVVFAVTGFFLFQNQTRGWLMEKLYKKEIRQGRTYTINRKKRSSTLYNVDYRESAVFYANLNPFLVRCTTLHISYPSAVKEVRKQSTD